MPGSSVHKSQPIELVKKSPIHTKNLSLVVKEQKN